MGMLVTVYRANHGDTTNNGISSQYDELIVKEVSGPFNSGDGRELTLTVDSNGNPRLTPMCIPEGKWVMFGGNYAGTSDSRWSQELRKLLGYNPRVVPIFDRVE